MSIPTKYAPSYLDPQDRKKQIESIRRARQAYKKGQYIDRPKLKSTKTRKSKHINRVRALYGLGEGKLTLKRLAKASRCSTRTLKKILSKGRGAYYSSGSRPGQTAESWARARLYSALSGGPAAKVDIKLLKSGCKKGSKALKMVDSMKERIVSIDKSTRKGKKYKATLENKITKKRRVLHFGGLGYAQYKDRTGEGHFTHLDHGDVKRMSRYYQRHSGVKTRKEGIAKEKEESGGLYTPKLLSHIYLW